MKVRQKEKNKSGKEKLMELFCLFPPVPVWLFVLFKSISDWYSLFEKFSW